MAKGNPEYKDSFWFAVKRNICHKILRRDMPEDVAWMDWVYDQAKNPTPQPVEWPFHKHANDCPSLLLSHNEIPLWGHGKKCLPIFYFGGFGKAFKVHTLVMQFDISGQTSFILFN